MGYHLQSSFCSHHPPSLASSPPFRPKDLGNPVTSLILHEGSSLPCSCPWVFLHCWSPTVSPALPPRLFMLTPAVPHWGSTLEVSFLNDYTLGFLRAGKNTVIFSLSRLPQKLTVFTPLINGFIPHLFPNRRPDKLTFSLSLSLLW